MRRVSVFLLLLVVAAFGGGAAAASYLNGQVLSQTLTARQLVDEIRTAKAGENRSFGYDLNGRLTSSTGPWGSGSYVYDPLSNIRSRSEGTSGSSTINYASNNRVTSATVNGTGRTYTYDNRGNTTSIGATGFAYDFANQPTAVTGTGAATFAYDGNFKRVKEVRSGKTIYTVYSRVTGSLLHRDQATDGVKTEYASAGGASFRLKKTGTAAVVPEYIHADHLGTPIAATDATGAVTWRESYQPFGKALRIFGSAPANDNNTGFTGHLEDDASGLVYMQARYYDPLVGRFLATDPIGYQDQLNLYAYVANDPVNKIDPDGLASITLGIEGELTYGVGVSGGLGLALSFPTRWDPAGKWDFGVYGTVSERVGYLAGFGAAVSGSLEGSVQSMSGLTYDATGGFGPIAITGSVPVGKKGVPDFGSRDESGSGSLPKGKARGNARGQARIGPNAGGSVGFRATGAISARDVARAVGGLFSNESAKVQQNEDGSISATISQAGSRITRDRTCSTNSDGELKC